MVGKWRFCLVVALAACALALLLPATATALDDNAMCISCHGSMGNADFDLPPVAKDTVCRKCHLPGFVGSHPRHQGGGNCQACHGGWGRSLAYALPTVLTSAGSFSSTNSQDLPAYLIHTIHATPRWPSNIKTTDSKCTSCHATAACSACHGDIIDLTHSQHGSLATTTSIGDPWTGNVSVGVTAFETEDTMMVGQSLRCGSGGCHDTDGVVAAAPALMDCYPHDAYPALGYISTRGLVSKTGNWTIVPSGTLNRETFSNYTDASYQFIFTGERVSIVATKDPYRGIGRVFIDNIDRGTFDEYSATTKKERRVWTSPELTPGTHTLKIMPSGSKNVASRGDWVAIDHIEVQAIAKDSVSPPCLECHAPQGAPTHGNMDHGYTAANEYNNLTQTGCTNSGAGCHASASTGDAVTTFHTTGKITCLSSGCHLSVTMDSAWKTANSGAECAACHAGNFVNGIDPPNNAVDATPLAGIAPAGHYSETTHTATGLSATVSAGGTYSAACTVCHNPVSATSIDGFYNQHQGLGGGLGDTTCADCHNANAAVSALVKDATRTDTCTACHNASALPTMVQHGSTAPAVAGTESSGAGSCATTGCHATVDVHALHKSNNSGNANGCMMADCHDAATQGWKPTAKSCGTGGACHSVDPIHPSEAVAHTTLASAECVVCHEMGGDLKLTHGNQCSTCHGRPGLNVLGKLECTSCHNGTDVGLHVYSPIDPNHYTGTETTHTASGSTNSTDTSSGGFTCVTCHKMEMKPEHITKTSSAFATATAAVDKCIACHESKVDALGAYPSWNKTCIACHATKHDATATKHDATAVGAACGGGSCHTISDVAAIHNNSVVQSPIDNPSSCVSACHVNNDNIPTSITCVSAGCHAGGHAHTLDAALSVGCYNTGAGCHNSADTNYAADAYHPANGCTSGACHTAANHNDPAFDGEISCQECHDAQYNNAPDVVPAATVHYNETTHTATSMTTLVGGYANNNACSSCHSAALMPAHATTSIGAIGCTTGGSGDSEGCHNDTDLPAVYGQIKTTNWTNDLCSDCHTSSHTAYTLGTHTAAATAGCALSSGCHGYTGGAESLDIRPVHDGLGVGCTATGVDSQGWTGGCHALNQSMPTGAMTCGALGTCHNSHTASNHMPVHDANNATSVGCTRTGCHELADRSTDTTSVIDYHSPTVGIGTPISGKSNNGCNICHGGDGWTDVAATAKTNGSGFECVGCHEGVLGGSFDPYDPDHYTGTETSHTAGDSTYTYDAGYPAVACSACHKLEMKPEHWKSTTNTSTMVGYVNTCVGCHEVKVDGLGAWNDTCGACHTGPLASHQATATAHDASAVGAGCTGEAATEQTLHSENFDGVTAPAWPATWTRGGTDSTLQVTTSSDASSAPNAAKFASDGAAAKSAYFEKTFDTSALTNPRISFDYKTAFPSVAAQATVWPDAVTTDASVWLAVSGTKVQAITAADGTNYIYNSTARDRTEIQYSIQDGGAGWTISNVTMYVRALDQGTRALTASVYDNGVLLDSLSPALTTSFATYSKVLVAPAGGWTSGNLATLGLGLKAVNNVNSTLEPQVDAVWFVVDYAAAPSSATNYMKAQYSTNGGGSWTDIMPQVTATTPWTAVSAAVPQSANLLVRFSSASDDPTRITYVDNIAVKYDAMASACHEVTNIAAIHNNSATSVTTADTTLCRTCHINNDAVPTNKTCLSAGCHVSGHSHPYTSASDYSQSAEVVGSESGCTGSGAGCHGAVGADRDTVTEFHAATAAGCTSADKCHTSATFTNPAWKAGTGYECVRCHDGGFVNSVDTTALADAAPGGHYGVTTHTVNAAYMANTVNAGGTASGACSACHSSTYRNAHGALSDGFASTSKGAYLTCQECHGYNAAVSSITTDTVRHDTCSACHTGTVLGAGHVVHGNAPVTAGTGTSCASTGVNCHGSDLHSIHKDATSCALTGCHAANKDMTAATKSCGSAGTGTPCHSTYTKANHYATYIARHTSAVQGAVTTTVAGVSPTCGSCHGMELNPEHVLANSTLTGTGADACEKCHGEAPGTFDLAVDNWANDLCSDCHGQPGISSNHTNMAGHNVVNTGCGASGAGCHPTQDLAQAGANKSLYIHNDCATCHDSAGATTWSYGVTSMKYNPLATTCGGASGCHTSTYYSATGPQIHSIGQAGEVNGDDALHTAASMTTTVGAYANNNTCSSCHSSGLRSSHTTTSIGAVGCTTGGSGDAEGCHNDTDLGTAPTQVKSNWTNNLCSDCHNVPANVHSTFTLATHTSGVGSVADDANNCISGGCHFGGSADVRAMHDRSSSGCTATGPDSLNGNSGVNAKCHAINQPMVAGTLSCGKGGTGANACHVNHTNSNHGISTGGMACYLCHPQYQTAMEDGVGSKTGATRASSVHHVMGGALGDGDIAPKAAAYPTSQTDVYCVSCHTDHNYFNGAASKAGNLRTDIANSSGASTSTSDFIASGSYGICVSCHNVEQAKQGMGTDQLNVGGANTPAIGGVNYNTSKHQYNVASAMGASATFNANCSKCHTDEQTKQYATGTFKAGTHFSAARNILASLGVAVAEPPVEEQACYACHSVTADGFKTTTNQDWFGVAAMDAPSQAIYGRIWASSGGYGHQVSGYAGIHKPSPTDETRTYISANKHVECADCHNVHAAAAGRHTPAGTADANGNNVSNVLKSVPGVTVTFSANNWTAPTYTTALGTATKEYQICFKCHSGYNTNVTSWGGAGAAAWTDQGFEFSPQNQSYHPVVAALPATDPGVNGSSRLVADNMRAAGTAGGMAVGGWSVGDTMYCSDCHAEGSTGSLGPHGSAVKWMLKGPNKAWPYTTAAGNGTSTGTFRAISAWATDDGTANGLFCYNCHVANASSATTRHLTSEYNHASYVCVACHIRVPHGGKVSRLMKAASTQTNLPARYMSDGNGGNVQAYFLTRFVKRAPNAYAIADCGVGGTSCYTSHNNSTGETW